MIGLKDGAATTTQPIAPAGGGFFDQMKSDFGALGDKLSAPYNNMTDEQKKRYQRFNELAMTKPQQPQFSPVQFGGASNGANLLSLIDAMKKQGF